LSTSGVVPRAPADNNRNPRDNPGLDRQQRRQLHGVGIEMAAVHAMRAMQQLIERQLEQRRDLLDAPAHAGGLVSGSRAGNVVGNGVHG
jgi:hypothetical protein